MPTPLAQPGAERAQAHRGSIAHAGSIAGQPATTIPFPGIATRPSRGASCGHADTVQAPHRRRPRFLKTARNHWRVEAIDQRRTRISLHATVQPRGVLGWLPYLLLRVQLARVAAGFLQDLRYYVEHGRPSPRKQRQLDTAKR